MTGEELRAAREAAHLTQAALGALMGMKHWRTLSHLEAGRRVIGPGMAARLKLALAQATNHQERKTP